MFSLSFYVFCNHLNFNPGLGLKEKKSPRQLGIRKSENRGDTAPAAKDHRGNRLGNHTHRIAEAVNLVWGRGAGRRGTRAREEGRPQTAGAPAAGSGKHPPGTGGDPDSRSPEPRAPASPPPAAAAPPAHTPPGAVQPHRRQVSCAAPGSLAPQVSEHPLPQLRTPLGGRCLLPLPGHPAAASAAVRGPPPAPLRRSGQVT